MIFVELVFPSSFVMELNFKTPSTFLPPSVPQVTAAFVFVAISVYKAYISQPLYFILSDTQACFP